MAEINKKLPVTIEDELRRSYLDYAMSVIIGRAIPDVRDGLKPVHRRILYSMHEQKVLWNQSYRKSARIVGDVLGKYHPHGDSAVYDALVRMAQEFSMRAPLVDGQGNFGSIDGDPPAAMRYTEVRMSRVASELLADIEKETVDFGPNFDDSEREPLVLPSRVPNLLVNGSSGIAVGMATNIPPHNLGEVVDASLRLIKNPDLTIDELMEADPETGRPGVTGPDFPTAGFIYGRAGVRQAYRTGRGRVVMRARARIEEMPGKTQRERIIVTELPYQVNKAELLKKIAELVREKRIDGIADLRDESDRDGMRMVIELKRDAHGEIVLNRLFQTTALQSTFGYNCLAIVGQRPRVLTLKECLEHFLEHRREVVTRRTRYDLRQAERLRELVEGLGMAVTEVDLVVKTIRESRDADQARQRLMALPLQGLEEFVRRAGRPDEEIEAAKARGEYFLSERQAKAILEMRLSRLTGLEREKLATEYGTLSESIASLEAILASRALLMKVIEDELSEIRDRYADARRTEIVEDAGEISMEDLVPNEEVVVTLSHAGYIKRVPLSDYRAQSRGGKGKNAMATRDEDFVSAVFSVNAHAHILFLSARGQAYLKKVWEIPEAARSGRGRAMVNFVGMGPEDQIAAVLPIRDIERDGFLLTCTEKGRVKRTELAAYANIRATGIIGVAIEEGDSLFAARLVEAGQHVLLGTKDGMSIRFGVGQVRPMGRDSRGVKGIDLREGDRVVGLDVIEDEEKQQVLSISVKGYGKRTPVSEWRPQKRGGLGLIGVKLSEKTGDLAKLRLVSPEDHLMVITDGGKVIRTRVEEIRETRRSAEGVRVLHVAPGESVVDVEPVAENDDDSDDVGVDAETRDMTSEQPGPMSEPPMDEANDEAEADDEMNEEPDDGGTSDDDED